MADSNGSGLIKGYVYVMVLLAALAGGAAYYFNSVDVASRKQMVTEVQRVIPRAYDIKEYLGPSLKSYHDFRSEGKISDVDKSEFSRTEERMDELIREVGLGSANLVKIQSVLPRETRDKSQPERYSVTVQIGTCTRAQWQRVIELARQRFGSYAVLEKCRIEAATRVNEAKDLVGAIDDAAFLYRVNLEYVWYQAPAPKATGPSA